MDRTTQAGFVLVTAGLAGAAAALAVDRPKPWLAFASFAFVLAGSTVVVAQTEWGKAAISGGRQYYQGRRTARAMARWKAEVRAPWSPDQQYEVVLYPPHNARDLLPYYTNRWAHCEVAYPRGSDELSVADVAGLKGGWSAQFPRDFQPIHPWPPSSGRYYVRWTVDGFPDVKAKARFDVPDVGQA